MISKHRQKYQTELSLSCRVAVLLSWFYPCAVFARGKVWQSLFLPANALLELFSMSVLGWRYSFQVIAGLSTTGVACFQPFAVFAFVVFFVLLLQPQPAKDELSGERELSR
jgi:hypothetical protein